MRSGLGLRAGWQKLYRAAASHTPIALAGISRRALSFVRLTVSFAAL